MLCYGLVSAGEAVHFEDIRVGEEYTSPARTVTEADIVIFAGLSGDYNVLHTDAEYMKASLFGERIAHGRHARTVLNQRGEVVQEGETEHAVQRRGG